MKTKQFDKKFHYLNNKHNNDANFVDEQTPRIYEKLAEMGISDPKHHYRINKFIETHNLTDKYPAKDLYRWHTLLTASCTQGKNNFFHDHGYDLENSEATLPEFFEAVSKEHGGEVIEYIRKRMEEKVQKKMVCDDKKKEILEKFDKLGIKQSLLKNTKSFGLFKYINNIKNNK